MKLYTKGVLVALTIILSAFYANAKSVRGDEITNKGYAFIIDDNNANVVLHPGLTAGQWKNVMERFTQMKFGKDLQTVLNSSTVEDRATSKYILYNTYWYGGQARSFGPDTINKSVLVYNGQPWLVVRCAQLISTDGGMIDNAINGVGCTPSTVEEPKQDNEQKDQKETNEEMNKLDVYHHIENGTRDASQVSSTCGFPWGWIIGIILALLLIGLIIYAAIQAANNARKAAMKEARKSDKKAIKGFLNMNNKANNNSAKNFVKVGNTLKSFSTPPAGQN